MTISVQAVALLTRIATLDPAHDPDRIASIRDDYRRFLASKAQLIGLSLVDLDNIDPTGALRASTTTVREDMLMLARTIAEAENEHISPSIIAFHGAWRNLYADQATALGLTDLDIMEIDTTAVQYRRGALPGDTVPGLN